MKYKNITSAIHNFGHSFTSLMNYCDNGYVIDDLQNIHDQNIDIEIDWINNSFSPKDKITNRISESMTHYISISEKHFNTQNVDISSLKELKLIWNKNKKREMIAKDNRDKLYKIYVDESK